jgi:hypothetical protein
MLIQGTSPVSNVDLQMKFHKGCGILAKNGCNFNFKVDGEDFESIIKKLGLSKENVTSRCCLPGAQAEETSE